jgi:DNA-binding response OmpR family regulator
MATTTTRPLRILVVDDDPAMVGAITALVGTEGHQVITAYDGRSAVRRFEDESPDLVLLDLAMPAADGFAVVNELRAAGSPPIIVVSGESASASKVRALQMGADDYVTKPFGKDELLARIAAVMRRATGEGSDRQNRGAIEVGPLVIDRARHEARVHGSALDLTPIEYRLLEALAARPDEVVPHDRLLRAGWPDEHEPDRLWLKPHLARLRAKVSAQGGPDIVAVRSVGYRLQPEGPTGREAS